MCKSKTKKPQMARASVAFLRKNITKII